MGTNAADRETVQRLCNHLVRAFEEFASREAEKSPGGLRYLDAQMGVHNFYKAVLLDLERRILEDGNRPEAARMIRRVAVDTLAQALGVSRP